MSFKLRFMTPERRARIEAASREIERLYHLQDRWLAEELLKLARAARADFPDELKNPRDIVYDSNFVWHVVPEVAKRLGATRLQSNEATDPRLTTMSNADLRQMCGIYLKNVGFRYMVKDAGSEALSPTELLGREFVNGNPVAFAVDRLAPAPEPGQDRDDYLAQEMRAVSARRGFEPTPYWRPELSNRPEPGQRPSPDEYESEAPGMGM